MDSKPARTLDDIAERIAEQFEAAFGSTSLSERLRDLQRQSTGLTRFSDIKQLREEAGDLLCSVFQLCRECGWKPEDLIESTLAKIASRTEIYRELGRKLRVAILRDAFDPIHIGDIALAKHVLRHSDVDEVWLMPFFDEPGYATNLNAQDRLALCRLAIQGEAKLKVFDYEIENRFRGERSHLIKRIASDDLAQKRCEFSWIISQETAETFATWSSYEGLDRLAEFIVVPGAGSMTPSPQAWYVKPPHCFLERFTQSQVISPDDLRKLIEADDPAGRSFIPDAVLDSLRTRINFRKSSIQGRNGHRQVAIFHQSFDPPSTIQVDFVRQLLRENFDEVVIAPRVSAVAAGEREHAAPMHRAALLSLAFQEISGATIDYDDISFNTPSSAVDLAIRHARRGNLWHVVDSQWITDGGQGRSIVHRLWRDGHRLWSEAKFIVVHPPGNPPQASDLPPKHRLCVAPTPPSSAELRSQIYEGATADSFLSPMVARYIARHQLFLPNATQRHASFRLSHPKIRIVANAQNPKSMALAAKYAHYESNNPDLILVLGGDGTMLHAIREHWRLRIPFLGLNTGHLGFLMNERLPIELEELELVSYILPMLRVDAVAGDGSRSWGLAFSDVWLERAEGQSAWMQLDVDSEMRAQKIVGDGMLVATAAGSSAYARAMGAVPVPLNTATISLVGSNIFQPRFWKPMAISDESLVRIANLDDSGKRPLRGFIDGIAMGIVKEISVRRSLTASVEMAFTREFDPSTRLLRSLFPDSDS